MNKNPFVPTPGYPAPQPPLPPGPPPPPQPGQPDYSAWWASAAAQQPHGQQAAVPQYNPQWAAPQPPRPPHDQSSLYANYGYGNAPGHWQRQQQQQHQQYQPGQPYQAAPAAPQAPQAQPGYNPYQPAAGYPQPYVPQTPVAAPPQPMGQPVFQPPAPAQPPFFNPHMPQGQPQQPRMHQPPAKRQRFDGPNVNRPNVGQHPLPPQPQFQPPIAPSATGGSFSGPGGTRNGPPSGPAQMNAARGGGPAGRGGVQGGRGRGGSFTNNRGGVAGRGGRGGSAYLGTGNANRGGGPGGQPGALRGHGSRNNFGGGARRGGGGGSSFNAGGFHRGSSFRNRDSGGSRPGGPRHDGMVPTGPSFGNKEVAGTSSFLSAGKKDENRRTLTDFKIVGLSIPELGWSWGVVPQSAPMVEVKQEAKDSDVSLIVKDEAVDDKSALQIANTDDGKDVAQSESKPDVSGHPTEKTDGVPTATADGKALPEAPHQPASSRYSSDINGSNPPPSRMRIYFHTPVTADDSRPIPHSASPSYEANRKGKRKKLEDDDGDLEEGRAPPPPPQMSGLSDDRASVAASAAPSVAETVSEDWLMAAIVEGEDDAGGAEASHHEEEGGVGESDGVHNAVYDDELDDLDAEGEIETLMDGDDVDDDVDMVGGAAPAAEEKSGQEAIPPAPPEPFVAAESHDGLPTGGLASGAIANTGAPNGQTEQVTPALTTTDSVVAGDSSAPSESLFGASIDADNADLSTSNDSESADAQAQDPSTTISSTKSLGAVSAEPTLLLIETQEATQVDGDTQVDSSSMVGVEQPQDNSEAVPAEGQDHLPEPPLSPSSNVHDDSAVQSPVKTEGKAIPMPSANRLSISYAGGNRRLVVNAEVVNSFKLFRHDGRVEVAISLSKDGEEGLKGVLVEGLSDSKSYVPIPGILDSSIEADETVPPFSKLTLPTPVQLVVHLDTVRPLSEPKWAKSGDVQEWLKSMFGRMFWVAGDAAEGWEKKIQVVDPDPPPTIWTFLDGWANNSPVGSLTERQRFVKTHMTEIDNVLEILLRLVRGERATPSGHNQPQISAPSLSGALLTALTPGSAHAAQQTHVSLAVLAIFRLTVEYAKNALGDDKGKAEAEDKVGDIIRCLPSHLIYKSLDGIFKEWKMEKKRG